MTSAADLLHEFGDDDSFDDDDYSFDDDDDDRLPQFDEADAASPGALRRSLAALRALTLNDYWTDDVAAQQRAAQQHSALTRSANAEADEVPSPADRPFFRALLRAFRIINSVRTIRRALLCATCVPARFARIVAHWQSRAAAVAQQRRTVAAANAALRRDCAALQRAERATLPAPKREATANGYRQIMPSIIDYSHDRM